MARILLVDDDIHFSAMLRQLLEREQYEVLAASDGHQAMELLSDDVPDLVITDLIMPDKDGIELVGELRRLHNGIKIIAISGGSPHLNANGQLKVAKFLGANLTFSKPLVRKEFVSAIKDLLETA